MSYQLGKHYRTTDGIQTTQKQINTQLTQGGQWCRLTRQVPVLVLSFLSRSWASAGRGEGSPRRTASHTLSVCSALHLWGREKPTEKTFNEITPASPEAGPIPES